MGIKKISNKLIVGKNILFEEGPYSLTIRTIKYTRNKKNNVNESEKLSIQTKATESDILNADFFNNPKNWTKKSIKPPYKFLWIMPPPGKGSGGHLNIFRFINALEQAGNECDIILDLAGASGSVAPVKAVMDGYPNVRATKSMKWLNDNTNAKKEYDGVFATSWETAYSAYNFKSKAKRFYFVQDFEPYFYPVGSLYFLAENTYRFNFFGVTAGGWLTKKLSSEYGMSADYYNFGSDKDIYKITNTNRRKSIFFYARPSTERRGFEMGIMTLGLFNKMHPDYKIILAGEDVSKYKIPFSYVNLKTLALSELNGVYNECVTGLVVSYTNMSLLPLELLASGAIPVVNDAPNNRLVSDNRYINYTNNDPISLASSLSRIVKMKDIIEYSKKASASAHGESWKNSEKKFIEIITRQMQSNE